MSHKTVVADQSECDIMLSLSVGEIGRSTFMPLTYSEYCPFSAFQTVFCFLRLGSLKNGKSSFLSS